MKAVVLLFAVLSVITFTSEPNWLTSFDQAQKDASAEGKYILMSFSGSDWCANCKRLDNDLFTTQAFAAFANENLVLLQLDFPAKKQNKLSAEQTTHNEKLAEKYNAAGIFPTVLVLDAQGNIVGKMKHPLTTVSAYINSIETLIK